MEIAAQEELVARYDDSAARIRDARIQISPLLLEAAGLLDDLTPDIELALWKVENQLGKDADDVQWRGDMLVETDRQLAHLIGTTLGRLVNPHLAERAIRYGWSYDEAELRAELVALRALPSGEQINRRIHIREIELTLTRIEQARLSSAPDAGGSLTTRRRLPFRSPSGTTSAAGLNVIIEALDHTADPTRVANDEFEIVHLDNGKILLVLPGVADLSETIAALSGVALSASPAEQAAEVRNSANALGWNQYHHSARDTWIAARASVKSTELTDNLYAQLVRDYVQQAIDLGDLDLGADVMIVGHSYGADTAVDLAVDPVFNGEAVNVTHVVAAAYHSEPQLKQVPGTTKVAVVQNLKDLVILGESQFDSDRVGTEQELRAVAGRHLVNTVIAGANLATEAVAEIGEGAAEVATNTAKEVLNSTERAHETIEYSDFEFNAPDIPSVKPLANVFELDNIVLAEFEGGFEGIGHHQNNYSEYLKETTNPAMLGFFEDVAQSGYTGNGLAWAVDVTVPEELR